GTRARASRFARSRGGGHSRWKGCGLCSRAGRGRRGHEQPQGRLFGHPRPDQMCGGEERECAIAGARAPEEAAPCGGLCAGALVEVHGLVGAPELNGKLGRLNGKVQGDRLGVDLQPPGGTKALRPENLRAVCEEA
ncbi:unnamed protein product, partial [Prorocentrum cordatum]